MRRTSESLVLIGTDLVTLMETRKISADDLESPLWAILADDYRSITHPLAKAVVSIKNAVLHQRRAYFVINREKLGELVRSDQNWPKPPGFDNNKYAAVLKCAYRDGFLALERQGSGQVASIFRLTDPEMLDAIAVDVVGQRTEAYQFIANNDPTITDCISDSISDPVVSR